MFRILCDASSGRVENYYCSLQLVAPVTHTTGPKITLPNTDYAHKNITSNFSQGRSALPEDGSQRIRNMSEFLIIFLIVF